MQDFLLSNYLVIKAFHILAVISWMAAMLYLPRLFVYHAERGGTPGEPSETLKVMEEKLLRIIMNPAMIVSWLTGILMITANTALLGGGWLHAKLTLLILMSACHGYFAYTRKVFLKDANQKSGRFFRILNEGPTVLMIGIVFLAILKPF